MTNNIAKADKAKARADIAPLFGWIGCGSAL